MSPRSPLNPEHFELSTPCEDPFLSFHRVTYHGAYERRINGQLEMQVQETVSVSSSSSSLQRPRGIEGPEKRRIQALLLIVE
jgi:hypothetical protein